MGKALLGKLSCTGTGLVISGDNLTFALKNYLIFALKNYHTNQNDNYFHHNFFLLSLR